MVGDGVIVTTQRARCDECPFESGEYPDRTALYAYMLDPRSDGKWYLRRGRHICGGCIIARACRVFGHVPDESNDWQCTRCMERIGPSFAYAEACHFCGTITRLDRDYNGAPHSTQDCRPDLFEHEIGPICSSPGRWCWWDHLMGKLSEKGYNFDRQAEAA